MKLRLGLLVTLTIISTSLADDQEEDHKFVSVKIGGTATLECEKEDSETITWTLTSEDGHNDTKPSPVQDGDVFELKNDKVHIKNVKEENLGIYRCYNEENEVLQSFQVDISVRLKKLPKSISIDEGSSTENDLKCSMISSGQEVVFKWFSRPEGEEDETKNTLICSKTEDSDCSVPDAQPLFEKKDKNAPVAPLAERSEIISDSADGIPFSILTIKETDKSDRKIFTCMAMLKGVDEETVKVCEKSKHCDKVETILRVKDPLAAVWPFCGIVVEVVILCIIIFFCEKRKSGVEKEDYDDGSNGHNVSGSRQRK